MSADDFGLSPASYKYSQFRSDVLGALEDYFGRSAVKDDGGNAFDLNENTYRVDADVTPFCTHRYYSVDGYYIEPEGTALYSAKNGLIYNWPYQHLTNSRDKNVATNQRYKRVVRVLKTFNLARYEPLPGFLIECLVYNTPDHFFGSQTLTEDVIDVLEYLRLQLTAGLGREWTEVSELKYLFTDKQKWTRNDALEFVTLTQEVMNDQ